MDFHVKLYFGPRFDLYSGSKILTGLCGLAQRGVVELELGPDRFATDGGPHVHLDVTAAVARSPRRVTVDLSDHNRIFYPQALDACDVYFKRSYYAPEVERLPPPHGAKVVPYGMNFACTNRRARFLAARRVLSTALAGWWSAPRQAVRALASGARELRHIWLHASPDELQQGPEVPVEPVVLFQTRVWPPEDSTDDLHRVNEARASLVRRLRAALGPSFRGGFVPWDFARRAYPDLVVQENYRQADYIRTSKRALVGIYTRGLHDSLAFKMPEYLASSKCVVAEPLRNALPAPLVAGRHYLEFRSEDECVAHCENLLTHPDVAAEMRRANHAYYRQWVEPEAHAEWLLRRACEAATAVDLSGGAAKVAVPV